MKKSAIRIAIGVAALCLLGILLRVLTSGPTVAAMRDTGVEKQADSDPVVVACPGRVEGRSDTIAVGAATDGVVQAVHVREGDIVAKGAVLAEIGCSDIQSSLSVAQAEAESVRQARAHLLQAAGRKSAKQRHRRPRLLAQ